MQSSKGKPRKELRRYIVRKYIMAESVAHALKLDNSIRPEEVSIDYQWLNEQKGEKAPAIGFTHDEEDK